MIFSEAVMKQVTRLAQERGMVEKELKRYTDVYLDEVQPQLAFWLRFPPGLEGASHILGHPSHETLHRIVAEKIETACFHFYTHPEEDVKVMMVVNQIVEKVLRNFLPNFLPKLKETMCNAYTEPGIMEHRATDEEARDLFNPGTADADLPLVDSDKIIDDRFDSYGFDVPTDLEEPTDSEVPLF